MRPVRLLAPVLALALALAGCASPFGDPEGVTPAATANETPPDVVVAPSSSPPADPAPASSPPPASAPPPASQNATAPPAAPAPPAPVAWNLTGAARLGWVAAVGTSAAGAPSPVPGQADADHCPDATFTVPAGATGLRVVVQGEHASPEGPGAGAYDIIVTPPGGEAIHMAPAMDSVPPTATGNSAAEVEAPAIGIWSLHAEPIGPAAQQVWTVMLEASGASLVAPTDLAVVSGC